MTIDEIKHLKTDAEMTNAIYTVFDEDARLSASPAARVEFTTTVSFIERYLTPGMRILDIGAGTGTYSLFFAKKGCQVSAIELADTNIAAFRKKLTPDMRIDLTQGNALDLSAYADELFDIVLLFGPLYHLHDEKDRDTVIREAMRVLKKDGTLFVACINNDMIPFTEWDYRPDYLINGDYDKDTFKVDDFPFVFFNLSECREMLMRHHLRILHEVASDGMSELLAEKINALDEAGYEQYLKLHLFYCERQEHLGKSNHYLFVTKKTAPYPEKEPEIPAGLTLRKLVPDDAEQMLTFSLRIGGKSDNLTFGADGIPISIEQERAFLQQYTEDNHSVFYGVWKNDELIATASLNGLPRRMKHRANIALSVVKAEWNHGIGSLLMECLIRHAVSNGMELLNLEVRHDNLPAIHLYEKFGFQKVGTLPAYFKIGDDYIDFLAMCLDLRHITLQEETS